MYEWNINLPNRREDSAIQALNMSTKNEAL